MSYTGPAATRAGTAKHICFCTFRKAVFSRGTASTAAIYEPNYSAINSNLRRTCNTRTRRRPACTFSTPVSASTPGNTGRRPQIPGPLVLPPPCELRATQQQPRPAFPPGPSPAFRYLSRRTGYSTYPLRRESATLTRPGVFPLPSLFVVLLLSRPCVQPTYFSFCLR